MYFILCQSSYTLLIDNIISLCAYIGNVTMIGFPGVSHHPEQNARKPVSSVYVYDIVHVYCICTVHVYVNLAGSWTNCSPSRGSEEAALARSCPDDYGRFEKEGFHQNIPLTSYQDCHPSTRWSPAEGSHAHCP